MVEAYLLILEAIIIISTLIIETSFTCNKIALAEIKIIFNNQLTIK